MRANVRIALLLVLAVPATLLAVNVGLGNFGILVPIIDSTLSSSCSGYSEGTMLYDGDNKNKLCTGSGWKTLQECVATESTCNDSIDEDCDGSTDCIDSNCCTDSNCCKAINASCTGSDCCCQVVGTVGCTGGECCVGTGDPCTASSDCCNDDTGETCSGGPPTVCTAGGGGGGCGGSMTPCTMPGDCCSFSCSWGMCD